MELKKIKSFQVDHNKLERGMYISRIDGDVTTYDIRMKKPNAGSYLANGVLHTIEHLFATYVRSSDQSDSILYFGPMGCRTGFYLLTRGLTNRQAVDLTLETFRVIAAYDGPIPGQAAAECGNYREHDLVGARREAADFLPVMEKVTEQSLIYRS
jgi:S-ribosylhomocysteine lyase